MDLHDLQKQLDSAEGATSLDINHAIRCYANSDPKLNYTILAEEWSELQEVLALNISGDNGLHLLEEVVDTYLMLKTVCKLSNTLAIDSTASNHNKYENLTEALIASTSSIQPFL